MISLLRHNLSGMYVVADAFLAPSHEFLRLVCREKAALVTVLSLDEPRHCLSWPEGSQSHVVDLYDTKSIRNVLTMSETIKMWSESESVVILDGVTRFLKHDGIAVVLDTLLQLKSKVKCLLVTVHEDLILQTTLDQLVAACSSGGLVRLGPERNKIEIVAKRKGGKVVRSLESIDNWSILSSIKNLNASQNLERKELVLEDTNKEEKERLALPFVKTAVAGKMIFDVDDMKQGDYEEDADKSSEEEDLDSDLNF